MMRSPLIWHYGGLLKKKACWKLAHPNSIPQNNQLASHYLSFVTPCDVMDLEKCELSRQTSLQANALIKSLQQDVTLEVGHWKQACGQLKPCNIQGAGKPAICSTHSLCSPNWLLSLPNSITNLAHSLSALESGISMGNTCQPEHITESVTHYPKCWLENGKPFKFTVEPTKAPPLELISEFQRIIANVGVLDLVSQACHCVQTIQEDGVIIKSLLSNLNSSFLLFDN